MKTEKKKSLVELANKKVLEPEAVKGGNQSACHSVVETTELILPNKN